MSTNERSFIIDVKWFAQTECNYPSGTPPGTSTRTESNSKSVKQCKQKDLKICKTKKQFD